MIKWGGSDAGQCPAIYVADDLADITSVGGEKGGFVVLGTSLPSAVMAGLRDVADHEHGVWVPRSLLVDDLPRLLRQLAGNTP